MKIQNYEIKAFVFDMDGVLLDSEKVYDECWFKAAEEFGLDGNETVEFRKQCLGLNDSDCIKRLDEFFKDKIDGRAFYERTDKIARTLKVYPKHYAKEILECLTEKGFKLFLASSNVPDYAVPILKENDLWKYFYNNEKENFIFGDSVKKAKPDPEIYSLSVKRLGVNAKECFAIEDSPAGIESAYKAGLNCIMIPDRILPDSSVSKMCDFIFDDLENLLSLLRP